MSPGRGGYPSCMQNDLVEDAVRAREVCARLAAVAARSGLTVACAESLTSGTIAARLGAGPDAADWFRGGVVAYSSEVKHSLLDVPEGPVVCADAARAMAASAAGLLGADVAVAVTGVGGPAEQDGCPVGTVWFGTSWCGRISVEEQHFDGDPASVVEAAAVRALELLTERAELAASTPMTRREGVRGAVEGGLDDRM